MLADIAVNQTETSDVFLLVAVILCVVAAIAYGSRRAEAVVWAPVIAWIGVAFGWFALMVL